MNSHVRATNPVPESIKSMTREQFLAKEKFGTVSQDDLYWILYRSASEASDLPSFDYGVIGLLNERLGEGNYILSMSLVQGGYGGTHFIKNHSMPNNGLWEGDVGVLPGVLKEYGLRCFLYWV